MKITKEDILNRYSELENKDVTIDKSEIFIDFPNHTYKGPIDLLNRDMEMLHSFIISHRKKKDQIN